MEFKVKDMYYFEVGSDDGKWWFLTDDENKAKSVDPSYRLANQEDLDDAAAMGYEYNKFILRTSDGDFVWYKRIYEDLFHDNDTYECGYRRVDLDMEFDWEEKSPLHQSHVSP